MSPLPASANAAARMRAFRNTRRISGVDFADGVSEHGYKMTRSVLANIENGRFKSISLDMLLVVLEYLDVSWHGFFYGPLCNGCNDDPPASYICKVCGRSRDDAGELVKC